MRDSDQVGVLLPEDGRGLLQPVVRDLDEEVVDLVRPDVVHQVMRPAIVAIEGAEVAAHKVPLLVRVPRHILVVVMQECCDDEPGCEDEEGHGVMCHEICKAKGTQVGDQCKGHKGHPAGDTDDARSHVPGEHGVPGVEVVGAAGLVPIADKKVHEPAHAETQEGHPGKADPRRPCLLPDGVEYLVLVDVACVLVMMVM